MTNELNAEQFEAEVKKSTLPAVVDFSATWCGPCKALAPAIDKLANDYAGKAKVFSMDVDKAQAIATTFGIRGVPTVIFFKNGAEADRIVGLVGYDVLSKKLNAIL